MLQVEHAVIKLCLTVNGLVDEIESLDTAFVDLHQTVAPGVERIVDGISLLLSRLRTVVVWLVDNCHLLDIDNRVQVTLNHQIALCGSLCRPGLYDHLLPFAFLDGVLLIAALLLDPIVSKRTDNRFVLVDLGIERDGVIAQGIDVEAFHDVDPCPLRNLQRILPVVIVLFDRRLTALGCTSKLLHRGVVNRLILDGIHADLNRSRERIQPPVSLIGIGHDRTAVHIGIDFFHMVQKIHHIQEVHHTFLVDNGARHQSGAESDIVEVGDGCGMRQFLLIEIRGLQRCTKCHVGILLSVDVRLDRAKILIGLHKRRVRICLEIICHIIVGTGHCKCPCCQHQETVSKNSVHILASYYFTYLGVKNSFLFASRV